MRKNTLSKTAVRRRLSPRRALDTLAGIHAAVERMIERCPVRQGAYDQREMMRRDWLAFRRRALRNFAEELDHDKS